VEDILLSAIVCTLDRSQYLNDCLQALTRQCLETHKFEVIIVDNGSVDDTRAVAEHYCSQQPNFRYVYEDRKGLAVARNAGVAASRAEIVAFTDDDAQPEPSWAERICNRFATLSPEVAVLGGEVVPIWEEPRPLWLTDALLRPLSAGLMWGPIARFLRPGEWLVEVNTAYRKMLLTQYGGFPESLGRIGESLLSGEGCINLVLERAGYGAFYDPEILVGHSIPASRLKRSWFRRRAFWQGASLAIVKRYLDAAEQQFSLPPDRQRSEQWREIRVPLSPSVWADLFDDDSAMPLEQQLNYIEDLGFLLETQSVIAGR